MHELALMAELQTLAEAQARQAGATRIHSLQLRIGELAGVDGDALRLAFEVVVTNGGERELWRRATLDLETVPARCYCPDCRQPFRPADMLHACPRCGVVSRQLLAGRELELVALEVS
ncbi:MAG: hydrogenase maturation nickel metallochaperone HypA [Cyanobacteriota bacterium]|jgi:hydrogenase nickel incorporation protein HypA/HybF